MLHLSFSLNLYLSLLSPSFFSLYLYISSPSLSLSLTHSLSFSPSFHFILFSYHFSVIIELRGQVDFVPPEPSGEHRRAVGTAHPEDFGEVNEAQGGQQAEDLHCCRQG